MTDPNLEEALDGLMEATHYAEAIGEDELSYRIAGCYQDLGEAGFAHEEDQE